MCFSHAWQNCWLPADDYRLFCGDLGNEVNDDVLSKAFSRFPSFNMAKVSFFFTQVFYLFQFRILLLDIVCLVCGQLFRHPLCYFIYLSKFILIGNRYVGVIYIYMSCLPLLNFTMFNAGLNFCFMFLISHSWSNGIVLGQLKIEMIG